MAGRHIQNNIRKTMDIVHHVDKSGQKVVVMCIDFEKCFDQIEHKSIYGALKYFNVGERFIAWSKLFFMEFLLFTCNAGQTSLPFVKGRGVNQGCPISPFYYKICGELLAQRIINNSKIVGVCMSDHVKGKVEHVISQFMDDMCLYLKFSKECIQETINELMYVESNTGLKISYEKTTIYKIGSIKNSNAKIYTTKDVNWSDGDIETLGVIVNNSHVQESTDFDCTISKIDGIINLWYNRSLTLSGKI